MCATAAVSITAVSIQSCESEYTDNICAERLHVRAILMSFGTYDIIYRTATIDKVYNLHIIQPHNE